MDEFKSTLNLIGEQVKKAAETGKFVAPEMPLAPEQEFQSDKQHAQRINEIIMTRIGEVMHQSIEQGNHPQAPIDLSKVKIDDLWPVQYNPTDRLHCFSCSNHYAAIDMVPINHIEFVNGHNGMVVGVSLRNEGQKCKRCYLNES